METTPKSKYIFMADLLKMHWSGLIRARDSYVVLIIFKADRVRKPKLNPLRIDDNRE